MSCEIKRVAVLGAGVMGAGIAAHMANAGIPCYLLDIVPGELLEPEKKKGLTLQHPQVRSRFAINGKQNALKTKPAAFYSNNDADLVTVGNFEDHLDWLGGCDLVIEAVIENLKIKQSLFKRVAAVRKPGSIIASNTSGISVEAMVEGLPEDFQQHFCVLHFFNPPRYMKLLEIVPHPKTSKDILENVENFCAYKLGKGVIFGKDTPNFVANRIGVEGMMYAMRLMIEDDYRIDEVDAITGPALGRPRTASFKTADLVGLDTLAHVAKNVYENTPNDEKRNVFQMPEFIQKMVEKKWLGNKTGQGFYKKAKSPDGKTLRMVLDHRTMDYVEVQKFQYDSIKLTKGIEDVGQKIKAMVYAEDRAGRFAWKVSAESLIYSARRIPEICNSIMDIDNGMKWGFNFQLGPFEVWDAIGVRPSVEKMQAEGMDVPRNVLDMLKAGNESFYLTKSDGKYVFDLVRQKYVKVQQNPHIILLPDLKDRNKLVASNAGASLYDIGDGVACLEFHTKMNSVDADIIEMLSRSVDIVEKDFQGLVIANHAERFSVGANIFLILVYAKEKKFDPIEEVIRTFQDANMKLRYSSKPVVAAPAGMALGGGCEIVIHADRVQAYGETYIGLVEVGVGVIPAGGGTKELVKRMVEGIPGDPPDNILPFAQKAFVLMAQAKVATSAKMAVDYGILKPTDGITTNRDFLIHDAKNVVLGMVKSGYRQPRPMQNIPVGGEDTAAAFRVYVQGMYNAGYVTDYDRVVAAKLGHVVTGGQVRMGTLVSEQYLLDLEREAFLSLCGDDRTLARIEHMLTFNKPLRN
jgi:3-hydroxyacyl-CoA dehydrogenase